MCVSLKGGVEITGSGEGADMRENFRLRVGQGCVLRQRAAHQHLRDVHHLHVWSLDGETHVLTLHLVMSADASREDVVAVKEGVRAGLDPHDFRHVTVDVELAGEACVSS